MLKQFRNNTGAISLVEVIVTSIVFSIAAFGIYTTISASRPQSIESSKKLDAAYVGKAVIADLRSQIDAGTWDASGSNFETGTTHSFTNGGYTVTYTMTDDPDFPVRRMNMTIEY